MIQPETLLAAIDLGSNSFRLEIGRYDGGQVQRVDYFKEPVRQGAGLDSDRNLDHEAIERGLTCLARFGESIKNFPKKHVRAVATQTLREAKNRDVFLKQARKVLGYDIQVISGVEEARLIYQGVSRFLPQTDERRLVIDIGGRSTEFILGQQLTAYKTESLRVGSVTWSLKHFPKGEMSEKKFDRAEIAAKSFLDAIAGAYQQKHWDIAYGASSTVSAIADILGEVGYEEARITKKGLHWLRDELIKAKNAANIKLPSLREDRKPVIAGGLSVLLAIFDLLKINEMHVANGALRHGLLYDMITEDSDDLINMREDSVQLLANRFLSNAQHATNVRDTALFLFNRFLQQGLDNDDEVEDHRDMLAWAATLHEIGFAISHTEVHRHGAYILDHTELMGFSQVELHRLSQLVLGHYGKLKKLDFDLDDVGFVAQLLCLRLAVIFCHSRNTPVLKDIDLSLRDKTFKLKVSESWVQKHPQTAYLLEEQVTSWQKTDWTLAIKVSS